MKRKIGYLAVFAAILLFSSVGISCKSPEINEYPVNKDVLNFRDFSLNAEAVDLNTKVKGTIFVKGEKEKPQKRYIRISAWVEIDSRDWGGVAFYFPRGWNVTGIASDYPQGNPVPEQYTTTLSSGGESRMVYIGNSRMMSTGAGVGGEGSVIIDIEPASTETRLPESLEITVAVGSKGDVVMNPVSEKIAVPLNINYRTPDRPAVTSNVEVDSLIITLNGRPTYLWQDDPGFSQISREAVKIIEAVNSSLYVTESDQAEIRRVKQTGDYLEVRFDPPQEITTSRFRGRQWETVRLSSALFFFSGNFYRMAAWPHENRPDRYGVYGSGLPFDELEKLVRSVK